MDEKKKEREIRDDKRTKSADTKRKTSTSLEPPSLPVPDLCPAPGVVPTPINAPPSVKPESIETPKKPREKEHIEKSAKAEKLDTPKSEKTRNNQSDAAKKSPVVLPKFPPSDQVTPKREKKESTDGSEKGATFAF